jgi:hypothetical protein
VFLLLLRFFERSWQSSTGLQCFINMIREHSGKDKLKVKLEDMQAGNT